MVQPRTHQVGLGSVDGRMRDAITHSLIIPSMLSEASKAKKQLLAAVKAAGFDEHAQFAIQLALDEAVTNAVQHGNRNDPTKHITIDYRIDDRELRITITDEGPGFNPNRLPDPTLDENLELPNGRGVMLMRAYMTSVTFNPKGNQVTLIKRRDCKMPEVSA